MKNWIFTFLLFAMSAIQAQEARLQDFTHYYLFNAGYAYQNASYFEGGLSMYMVQPNNNILDLGITANLGAPKGKFTVIPEAELGYLFNINNSVIDPYSSNFSSAFWLVKTSVSPWHITPEVGITVVSLIDLTVGYGFEFREHDYADLEGLKIGLNIKLPFLLFWHD